MKKTIFITAILIVMALFALNPASIAGDPNTLTLDEVLSSPFPYNLICAEKANRIAWVYNSKGARNIWYADGPGYKPQQLTDYTEDSGIGLSQLHFTPDGSILIYVRGGAPNRDGEHPNPMSLPKMTVRTIWSISMKKKTPVLIAEGSGPVVSPSGKKLIFLQKGKVFITPSEGGGEPEFLFKARGNNGSLKWSPDGSKIAFVSSREDHSFIGIYHLKEKRIEWILPDINRDTYPVWSPGGEQIAFIRMPGLKAGEEPSWMSADVPFSIIVYNIKNGSHREIVKKDRGAGFAQYYTRNPLLWANDEYIVFYSEQNVWMQLYSVNTTSGRAVCLTPGEYIAEHMSITKNREKLIFNSNRGDIDRRHLFSVPVKGGEIEELTGGDGLEWSPVIPDAENIVCICSTGTQPAALAKVPLSGGKPELLDQNALKNFPMKKLVQPEQVIFKAGDGLRIHGQLFRPKRAKKNSHPAVIYMHGGPIRQMLLDWHYSSYYHNCYAFNQYLASKGYVVLSVNYRSGIGYGSAFRTAPRQGPAGASEYQDIIAAAKYLQTLPEVNPLRIGLWGGSYGGYLTALGLARDSDLFAAGVDLHGVHDWALRGVRRNGGGWGVDEAEEMMLAYESSPVSSIDFWTSPVLFVHGDDDRNVDFIQTTDLAQRLKELGKAHIETIVLPDEVHGFLRYHSWYRVFKEAASFFDRFLKK